MKIPLLMIVFLMIGTVCAQTAKDFGVQYGEQRIVLPTTISTSKDGDRVSILVGRTNNPSIKNSKPYGIQFSGKVENVLSRPLIELRDASADRLIRKITVGDLLGKESDGWKAIPGETTVSTDKIVSCYSFHAPDQQCKFYRTVQIISDEHLPLGKGLLLSFAIAAEKPLAMSMRFLGECDGALAIEGNSFLLGDSAKEQSSRGMIIVHATGASSIKSESKEKKGEPTRFTIESAPIDVPTGKQTTLLSLSITGTTVGQSLQTAKQAHNIMLYNSSQTPNPDLVAITTVNRQNTNPGDTVVYTISYYNIGTAPGVDIEINNPVPVGTRYIENTAKDDGSVISFMRSGQNVVTAITWKFNAPINPGGQRLVRFSAVVQ